MKIRVDKLIKTYGEHAALEGLSMEIEEAKCLAFIGPSGGGKSTALRLLAGLEHPSSGSIEINDEALPVDEAELRNYRKSIGIVFQGYNLFPHLNALDNITLPLEKAHGLSRKKADARARELLGRFRLDQHAYKRPAELSGGQNQRIAIARSLAHNPELIFFDEPTSALDPEMTAEVLDVIEELIQEGKDCVVVTHQMGFAKRVSDHICFLANGSVLEHGRSLELFENPREKETRRFLERVLRY